MPIRSLEELHALYPEAMETAVKKECQHLLPQHCAYIEASPFVLIATAGPEGLDCSPRGDAAPAVRIVDSTTLELPDRRGNNRLDTLRNIVRDGRVGLLFLIPGVGVPLRVNGTAELHAERELLASYAVGDKVPATVIRITVSSVYTQCPKALIRSELWNPERFRDSADLPTVGQIMQTITNGEFDGAAWDAGYPKLIQETIY